MIILILNLNVNLILSFHRLLLHLILLHHHLIIFHQNQHQATLINYIFPIINLLILKILNHHPKIHCLNHLHLQMIFHLFIFHHFMILITMIILISFLILLHLNLIPILHYLISYHFYFASKYLHNRFI